MTEKKVLNTLTVRMCLLCIVLFLGYTSSAQVTDTIKFQTKDSLMGWSHKGHFNFNFSNVGFKNWTGGGENALSLTSNFQYVKRYESRRILWETEFDMVYGLTRLSKHGEFRKTDDMWLLKSVYGFRLSNRSNLTLSMQFRSQLTKGYEYTIIKDVEKKNLVSKFMAPGYLSLNIGYTLKKPKLYSITLSPITGKFTFVLSDSLSAVGTFGLKPGQKVRFEGGTMIKGRFKHEVVKNVVYELDADFFSAYRKPEAVDVHLRSALKMKVNEYLTSGLSGSLIYDEDVSVLRENGTSGPDVQYRYMINLGVSIKILSSKSAKTKNG